MLGKSSKIVFCLALCFAYASANDYYDYQDGPQYYDDGERLQLTDGNVSMSDLTKIVHEEVEAARRLMEKNLPTKILGDDRLSTKINSVREKTLNKERECRSKNFSYWDAGIPECRNCLEMKRCQDNEACRRECRGILKIRQLENRAADTKEQLENQEQKIASMEKTIEAQQKLINALVAACILIFAGSVGGFLGFFFWVKKLKLSSPSEATSDRREANHQQEIRRKGMLQTIREWFSRRIVAGNKAGTPLTNRTETPRGPTPEYGRAVSGETERLTNGQP